MPKQSYISKRFRVDALQVIAQAEAICNQYAAQGFSLTLRQLYYQFVSRGLIANKDSEYKRLGGIINDARLAGYIDWDHLEDRTRNMRDLSHWDSPSDIMATVARQFRYEKWNTQPERVIVMIEKDALVGVIENVCQTHDVPFFSCRGYVSQSEMWTMAQRFVKWIEKGQRPIILHLGDHDPSGLDMSEDIDTRLTMFVDQDLSTNTRSNIDYLDEYSSWGGTPEAWRDALKYGSTPTFVERLALNWNQIQQYNPPPNPAKVTDVRFTTYENKYGTQSWELDALDPAVISQLIEDAILLHKDQVLWDTEDSKEKDARSKLRLASKNWDSVADYVDKTFNGTN